MTAAAERLAVIGPDPAACARLRQALIDGKADQHDVLDASPLAQAILAGHAPDWPAGVFFVLIGPIDGPLDGRATPADSALRSAMFRAGVEHAVLSGPAAGHADAAGATWRARRAARSLDEHGDRGQRPVWRHACGRCGDGACEARLFETLRAGRHA
ncbi:hypothetical protein [Leptothrix discophora]|uniref:Uncharacterized protein n=1 Tax=Leptothrix discophora TaxID=89 RepID=A0ABT9G0F7_LEPDI|nr:hypothetical protein [Leptothrix discophora]MDP4299891.1 hypothetical protein [Leptothrix discophora]